MILTNFGSITTSITTSINTTYLYDMGDEKSSLTGGWGAYPYRLNDYYNEAYTPTITKNSNNITSTLTGKKNAYYRGIVSFPNSIDLTNYTTLKVHVNSASAWFDRYGAGGIQLAVMNNFGDPFTVASETLVTASGTSVTTTISDAIISLDVSAISGSKWICIHFLIRDTAKTASIQFDKVWLE